MNATADLFDHEADVVVVGSGAAGYAAAVAAASKGAEVLVLEWAETVGGTTAAGGATAWVPNNPSMGRLHSVEDPRADALRYMCRLAFPQHYDPSSETLGLPRDSFELIETFYDRGSEMLEYFEELGALTLESELGYPDYHADLPENVAPRGRHMHVPQGSGGLIDQLGAAGERLGVRVLLGHRVNTVLRNDAGEIIGVEARTGTRTVLARARRAVVFGTGGFLYDAELVRTHLPGKVFGGCPVPTTAGDFVKIGQELGTPLGNMHGSWWKQVLVEQAVRSTQSMGSFMPFGDSMIQVNKYGQRVVNEKSPYNERTQVHFHWNPTKREYSNLLMFMIWDEAVASNDFAWPFRPPVPMPGESSQWVISGGSWEELASNLDARLAELEPHTGGARLDPGFVSTLESAIERFNELATTGKDEDFARGETPIEIDWTGPGRPGSPNPTMAPFRDEGPYYCVILGAGVLDTNGGPKIDTSSRVLGADGSPIPGLYGAGNCVASINGQAYWGPGATIGPALTYGYIAGCSAADEPVKDFVWQ
jgi:succinate dehydrogenase/fumarate reductase flavoprotein subunit